MSPLTPPRGAIALALIATLGCIEDPAAPTAEPLSGPCRGDRPTAVIDRAGGEVCAGRHRLVVPPGALVRPTRVQLIAVSDPPPVVPGDLVPVEGARIRVEIDGRSDATDATDAPALRLPALWTASALGEPRDNLDDLALLAAGDVGFARAGLPDGRLLPAVLHRDSRAASALLVGPGEYLLAEPLEVRLDGIPAAVGTCHPMDAMYAGDPIDEHMVWQAIDALIASPPVTDRLADLIRSPGREPGELADAIDARFAEPGQPEAMDGLPIAALRAILLEGLADRLCVGTPLEGEAVALRRAADLLAPLDRLRVTRDAAIALAGWALLEATADALLDCEAAPVLDRLGGVLGCAPGPAGPLCVDPAAPSARACSRPAARREARATALTRVAGADPAEALDLLALADLGFDWALPRPYALRLGRVIGAGDAVLERLAASAAPLEPAARAARRCVWRTLVAPATNTRTALPLEALAERAWLDDALGAIGELPAARAPAPDEPCAFSERLLGAAMRAEQPLFAALLHALTACGDPIVAADLWWSVRRAYLDTDPGALDRALSLVGPPPGCVTPPQPEPGRPDDCAPIPGEARAASACPGPGSLTLRWRAPAPRCAGGRPPVWRVQCGPRPDAPDNFDSGPLPRTDHTLDCAAHPGCCGEVAYWRVGLVDPITDAARWSPWQPYGVAPCPPAIDPCADPADECNTGPDGALVVCPPAPRNACIDCRAGRCVPPDEVDGAQIDAPVDPGGLPPDIQGGERVELPCADAPVRAPIDGVLEVGRGAICIRGDAVTLCLGGLVLDAPLEAGCTVEAGALLGRCVGPVSVEAYGPDDARRPLSPPAQWSPPGDGTACCATGATELCDGIDDDCDGVVDEGLDVIGPCARTCPDDTRLAGERRCVVGEAICLTDGLCPPPGDRCDDATRLPAGDWSAAGAPDGDTRGATDDHVGVGACGPWLGGDVHFEVVIDRLMRVELAAEGDRWRPRIALYRAADGCDGARPAIACGERIAGVELEPGAYRVVVDGAAPGDAGAFTLRGRWDPIGCEPGARGPGIGPDGRSACCDGITLDRPPEVGAPGEWVCGADGRSWRCVDDACGRPPPLDAMPPEDEGVDPDVDPADVAVEPPDCGPAELITDAGVCDPCPCRLMGTEVGQGMVLYPGAAAEGPVMRLIAGPAEGCGEGGGVREFPCDAFPLSIIKTAGRAAFDPSEPNDRDCLEMEENDDARIDITSVEFRVKVSADRGFRGEVIEPIDHEDIGQCVIPIAPLALTPYFPEGGPETVYLHVVRDACPDPQPDDDDERANYWISEPVRIERVCPGGP